MFLLQALGSNGSGQLGIGHKDDVSVPQTVILPSSLTTTSAGPRCIAAGGNHTLLLLSSGELLWAGDATTGACGRLTCPPNDVSDPAALTPEFRPVDLSPLPQGAQIQLAAATWTASTVVATVAASHKDTGVSTRVYSFGAGDKGELGLGPSALRAPEPTQVPDFPPIGTWVVDLASCMGHVVAVLSNGEAWGWGSGRKGQLGSPAIAAVCSPRRIEGVGFKVVRAVCGREFTCLFGAPETGEIIVLGSDKWGVRSQAPGSVVWWKDVGAGWSSVFVLKEEGALLSWGRDDHGQLAREDLGRVRNIAVGSEHTLALTEDGDVVAWGWGEHGNCGPIREGPQENGQRNRIASNKTLPTEQEGKITMIGAGCATSWVIIEKT
ncbi:Protein ATS1 [Madurella mycetomatis]|uniref:Protein ATS1 n=1 Tax=Madurella mycetomatis TaxID=100816 RepID=A0A175VUP6_9PEZI|nr:Protein ATS1 [Madurella mycetomatis]